MPDIDGWRITSWGGGKGNYARMEKDNKVIEFGGKDAFKQFSATNVVDMRGIYHSADDTLGPTIGAFTAGADAIAAKLPEGPVGVHCDNGRSRTSFVIIAYLMRHEAMSYEAASALLLAAQETRGMAVNLDAKNTLGNGYKQWLISDEGMKIVNGENKETLRVGHVWPNQARARDSSKRVTYILSNAAKDKRPSFLAKPSVPQAPEPQPAPTRPVQPAQPVMSPPATKVRKRAEEEDVGPLRKRRRTQDEITLAEGKAWLERFQSMHGWER